MALNKITGSVDRIKEILERWKNIPEISDIERELVLDKLKQIYEEVMFFERAPYADEVMNMEDPAEKHSPEPESQIEETTPQKQPETASEQKQFEEAEPDVKTIISNQILFEEEIVITPRQPVDRDTILSLYGNDPARTPVKTRPLSQDHRAESVLQSQGQQKSPEPLEMQDRQKAREANIIQESQSIEEEFDLEILRRGVHTPTTETAASAVPKKVFEEIIDNGDDLRRSIGLNDKFLLTKELFGGDSVRYEEFITTLDKFTDLDDALIHIQETYSGNPDGEGIKLLVDLIEKKLG